MQLTKQMSKVELTGIVMAVRKKHWLANLRLTHCNGTVQNVSIRMGDTVNISGTVDLNLANPKMMEDAVYLMRFLGWEPRT